MNRCAPLAAIAGALALVGCGSSGTTGQAAAPPIAESALPSTAAVGLAPALPTVSTTTTLVVYVAVPYFLGKSVDQVLTTISATHLAVKPVFQRVITSDQQENGQVLSESPTAGNLMAPGSTLTMVLGQYQPLPG